MASLPECTICLENLVGISLAGEEKEITAISCGHTYHSNCLAQHFLVYPRCPICSIPSSANDPTLRKIYISTGGNDEEDEEDERTAAITHLTILNAQLTAQKGELAEACADLRREIHQAIMKKDKLKTERNLERETVARERAQTTVARATVVNLQRELKTLGSTLEGERQAKQALEKKYKSLKTKHTLTTAQAAKQPSKPSGIASTSKRSLFNSNSTTNSKGKGRTIEPPSLAAQAPQKRIRLKAPTNIPSTSSDSDDSDATEYEDEYWDARELEEDEDENGAPDEEEENVLLEEEVIGSDDEEEVKVERVKVFWSGRGSPWMDVAFRPTDTLLVFKAAFQSAAGLKAQGGFKLPSGEIWSKGSKTMGQLRVKPNQSLTALSCRKVT